MRPETIAYLKSIIKRYQGNLYPTCQAQLNLAEEILRMEGIKHE